MCGSIWNDPDAPTPAGQVLPQIGREVEICSQNERKLSISREKTHALRQIGVDIAAETNGMLEISCEQQNHPAHDMYDPFTPGGHVALEDIHHTLSNFEVTFLSSVLSTSSLRAMTMGVVAQFVTSVTKLHLSRNMPTSTAFFTSLKEGEMIAELLSVCRVTTRLSGNRQGGESPYDCECLGCSE